MSSVYAISSCNMTAAHQSESARIGAFGRFNYDLGISANEQGEVHHAQVTKHGCHPYLLRHRLLFNLQSSDDN